MTQHTNDTGKGHDMAIDFEKEERRREQSQERRQLDARTALRVASTAHHIAAVADMVGEGRSEVSPGLGAASALGAALEVGESLEVGLSQPSVDERMQKFPELREVEIPTGAAARFPELREKPSKTVEDESELDR